MKMTSFFKMSVLAVGMVAALGANAADDGTINITGELLASACQVDAASISSPIALGDIASGTFAKVGDASTKMPFSIHITDCPDSVTEVMMAAVGTKDATNQDLLALASDSLAAGLGIALYNNDDSQIKMGNTTAPVAISADTHEATIAMKAAAVSTAASVAGGAFSANTNFILSYN